MVADGPRPLVEVASPERRPAPAGGHLRLAIAPRDRPDPPLTLRPGRRHHERLTWPELVHRGRSRATESRGTDVARAGVANLFCGSLEDALTYFHRANRLSSRDSGAHVSLTGIGQLHLIRGSYDEALVWATRALASNPNFDATYWVLIAANAHLGRMDEARRFLKNMKRKSPGVTIASIKAAQHARDPSHLAAILEGLRLAGLDEG